MPKRGTNPTDVEVEWQLDALDLRPVERWLATFPRVLPGVAAGSTVVVTVVGQPVKRTVDVYLDTDDWRIGRSGFVLRIRHLANEGEVTLKDTTPAVSGLRRRLEVSEPLPAAGLHALGVEGPVGRRLRALAGQAPLRHLLEIRTRRRPYILHTEDGALGEVDLDDTIIVVGDDQYPVRMRRVEVEADPRWIDLLTPLVDQLRRECGLQPAILSKFEAGLLAAGLRVPELPDLGPTTLSTEPTVGAVAYAVLRRNLESMLDHEAGSRLGEDIEQLHDMRVATRRLRAALALFTGVLPGQANRLRGELGWLAGVLGAVRDLDVQLERLDGWSDELPKEDAGALADLARLLGRERDGARENLLLCLDSPRYDSLVSEFTSMLRPGPGQGPPRLVEAARAPATVVVPGLIIARHRSAVNAARRARRSRDPADLHRLRIRCKRLRYALEFVSDIYDGQTRGAVQRVVALQDCLGLMQDARVAAGRLHALGTTEGSELSPTAVFAMGAVADRYRREADRLAGTLPGCVEGLKGRPWRKLMALMERRRLEMGPPDRWAPAEQAAPGPAPGPAQGNVSGRGPDASGGSFTPGPHAPTSPELADTTSEDPEWDDEYPSTLRSVALAPRAADRPTSDEARGTWPPLSGEPPGGRRRKDPVFLPASPSPPRPGPRPGPGRPAPPVEPPGREPDRSSHERP